MSSLLRARMSRCAGLVAGVAAVAYPLALHLLPRPAVLLTMLGVLTMALLVRVLSSNASRSTRMLALAGAALLVAFTCALGTTRLLRLQPALLNGALLVGFAASLWRGTPLIERIARARDMPVGPHNLAYLRGLTAIWTGFFALATVIALITLVGDPALWLWWNGGLVYGAILILVIGERWYRGIYRRRLAREGRLPTTP